jgi:hypothetical protein
VLSLGRGSSAAIITGNREVIDRSLTVLGA